MQPQTLGFLRFSPLFHPKIHFLVVILRIPPNLLVSSGSLSSNSSPQKWQLLLVTFRYIQQPWFPHHRSSTMVSTNHQLIRITRQKGFKPGLMMWVFLDVVHWLSLVAKKSQVTPFFLNSLDEIKDVFPFRSPMSCCFNGCSK